MIGAPLAARVSFPRFRFGADCKLCWDGNSLVASSGLADAVAARAPVLGSAAFANCGVNGQTWADMLEDISDAHAMFDATKRNVLLLWETGNAVGPGGGANEDVIEAAQDYIAAMRAENDWAKVVVLTTPPRTGGTIPQTQCAEIDDYMLANAAALGIDHMVDIRRLVPELDFLGDNLDNFAETDALGWWNPDHVHFTATGIAVIADAVCASLRRMRR